MAAHQWVHRYPAPTAGKTIGATRPGEHIAQAIKEIQNVIDGITGADGKDDELIGLPTMTGASDGMLCKTSGGGATWDWVRAR